MRYLNPLSSNHLLRIKRWDILKNIGVNYKIVSLENINDSEIYHHFPIINCDKLYIYKI